MKERIAWIDISKGIGITLVIMGHCFNKETVIHNWIFSFHMPLFFLLSGWCFHYSHYITVKRLAKKKIKTLIVPYIGFCILGVLCSLWIPEWREAYSIKGVLVDIYLGYPTLTNITSTWYLIALFNITIIFYIVLWVAQKTRKQWIPYVFVGLSGIFGYSIFVIKNMVSDAAGMGTAPAVGILPGGRLPLTLDACMMALVFFAFGYFLRCNWKKVKIYFEIISKKLWIVGAALFFVQTITAVFLNTRVNIHGCSYGNIVYFFLAALSGSFWVIIFSKRIGEKFNVNLFWGQIYRFFKYFGQNSLFILGIQSLFVHLLLYIINRTTHKAYILYENVPLNYGIISFIVITFIMVPLAIKIRDLIKNGLKFGVH